MYLTLALFLLELSPALAFYLAGQQLTFAQATWVYVAALALVLIISVVVTRRLPYLSLLFGFFVISAGLVSIYKATPDILIVADTVYFALTAMVIWFTSHSSVSVMERFFGGTFGMTKRGWYLLSRNWTWVLIIAAISNEMVRFLATPEFWIDYQFWRGIVLLGFACSQFYISSRYRLPDTSRLGIRLSPIK
jgi:intracellular septation protein